MKTSIDTISEAFDKWLLELPTPVEFELFSEDPELSIFHAGYLAALSTIEAEANATKVGHYFCAQMPCSPTDCTEVPCRYMKDAITNRNNRDPEAIRRYREAIEKASLDLECYASIHEADAKDIDDIIKGLDAAILGAEPSREECKACGGQCPNNCPMDKD